MYWFTDAFDVPIYRCGQFDGLTGCTGDVPPADFTVGVLGVMRRSSPVGTVVLMDDIDVLMY
jgi:hypothetical protein